MTDAVTRARTFVETVLMPLEEEAERAGGRLPEGTVAEIKRAAIAAGLHGGNSPARIGGQGWSMREWFAVNEQFGRVTNGLHWWVPQVYNVWEAATDEQVERWVAPALRGEGGDAYAVTEADAGSDASGIATTAHPLPGGGWRVNGEKWFVTSGDVARVLVVMANVIDGGQALPTLLLIEPGAPGVEFVDDPQFTHNYPHGHPTIRFTDVEIAADAVIGGVGEGEDLQRRWFTDRAAGNRHPRPGRDVAAARRDDRVGAAPSAGGPADHGLPGHLLPAGRLGDRRRRRPPAGARGVRDGRRGRRPEGHPRQGLDGQAVRE